jgi:hypothetical protein
LWSLLIVFSGSGKVSQLRPSRKKDIPTEAEQLTLANAGANEVYDLFTVSNLNESVWTFLERGTNGQTQFVVTNPPEFESYYLAACTNDDADGEGLTDSYEVLVSKSDPNDPDTDYDGRSDYEELVQEGTLPLDPTSFTPVRLAYFRFNDTNWLGERGQIPLASDNLQSVDAWITKGVQLTNTAAMLKYRTVESDGKANINLRSGTVRFWFKPLWNSGTGPATAPGKLIEVGSRGDAQTNGWWSLFVNTTGDMMNFVSQTNDMAEVTNLTASVSFTSNRWCQIVLTATNGTVALYTNGMLCASGSASLPYPPLATRTNGFTIGSDTVSDGQAKGVFEDLETFNYPLTADDVLENFQLTQPPDLIPNLQQWLIAGVVTATNPTDRVNVWLDQSGNTNNASSSGTSRPYLVTNVLNSLSVIRFYGSNYFGTYLNSSITNWTEAEAFVVLKVATNKPGATRGLWRMDSSGGGNLYPNTAGEIIDTFASKSTGFKVGSTSQGLTNFHLYNPLSRQGEWAIRLNGAMKYHNATNAIGLTATPALGLGAGGFDGDIAEVLLFNRVLNSTERQGLGNYLNQRYQLIAVFPQAPSNFTANVLSPGQISLWWNTGTNNEQTVYRVERSADGTTYAQIGEIEGASFIDSGLATNTPYYYRVSAANLAGESTYTTTLTATTSVSGVDMPLDPATLKLWLKADHGALVNYDGTLNSWLYVSGNTNVVTYPGSDRVKRPYWFATTNALNNHPVVRFFGSNSFEIQFSGASGAWTNATEAEAFVVVKARLATNTLGGGLWRIGPGNSLYPDSAGNIRDTFARSPDVVISNVWQLTTSPHLFNPYSKPAEWSARINGTTVLTESGHTVAFYSATPQIGQGLNSFDGDIVECLIYNQVLTTGQRSTATEYLRRKYNLW